jgi:serine/threonine protein kinase
MKSNEAGATLMVVPDAAPVADGNTVMDQPLPPAEPDLSGATHYVTGNGAASVPTGNETMPPVPRKVESTQVRADPRLKGPAPAAKMNTLAPPSGHTDAPEGRTIAPPQDERNTFDDLQPHTKARPPEPGDHVNHYELIRLLGKGGMGSVFLARDNKLGRRVAIKFLHTQDNDLTKRFILEARTTARFSHENIVTIFEVDEHQGQPFMVLEYLTGNPLTKLLGDNKPMPPQRVVELMVPVVRALASAHDQNIVHRDLKFDNVLVTESGTIKVLDFGIAKVLHGGVDDDEPSGAESKSPSAPKTQAMMKVASPAEGVEEDVTNLTRHGTIMGTLAFMSPEQWMGVGIDHRADIWAAGVMLFRMLAGKHPLAPLTGMALSVTGRMKEPMPKLHDVAPDVPLELCAVVDRCLIKPKDGRWPDAISLLRGLEPFLPGRYTRELKIDESPYAGLSSFQESDADRFFGRDAEIAALVNRIGDQPLIGVVGPSGTGKSSFVRAGLVPALKRSGEAWETMVIRPGRNPLAGLADAIFPLVNTASSVVDELAAQEKLVERLRNEPGYVGAVLRSRARREKKHIMVFVDQFEELYTLVGDSRERMAFTACLSSIADDATSPTRVVLSIRSDFLDRVPEDQTFMAELAKGLFFLTAPANDGLRDALVQPAEMAGYHFEGPEIVDDMLAHLHATQGALPLLQFAASKLWDSRDPARKMLTKSSYQAIGGIAGALASHADHVVQEMTGPTRRLVRSVFLRLVTPDRTRAIVSMDELKELSADSAELQRLIDQLVQARLLVVQTGGGGGGASAELVHESLIHSWPTLKRWLDESGEDAAFIEQLRTAARQWQQKGNDTGLLWRGDVVDEARRFQKRYRGELPKVQMEFLGAVFAQEAKSARRQRFLAIGGVSVLAAAAVAASIALVVIRDGEQKAQELAREAKSSEALAHVAEAKATEAKADAEQRLVEVQAKEKERAAAAAEAQAAKQRAEDANAMLQGKNKELLDAFQRAEDARLNAKRAQQGAEKNAALAAAARTAEAEANKELQTKIQEERERSKRLESQLGGSTVIDTLK